MTESLKLLLFLFFVYAMILGFVQLYRLLNHQILESRTLLQVVGYALLLIAACLVLFFGGALLLFEAYIFLS